MAFLKYYAVAALLPIGLLFGAGLYLEPLQGDLTRLGNIAEKSWGWRTPQPMLAVSDNTAASPTTIVIGDSFSVENLWQSAAQLNGDQIFLTFHWSDIGRPECLAGTILNLKQRYPTANHFIVQTIERSFLQRFLPAQQYGDFCKRDIIPSTKAHPGATRIQRLIFDPKKPLPDLLYSINAGLAESRSYVKNSASGDVYISPLTRSDLFSNIKSGLLLFYAEDLQKNNWTAAEVELAIHNAKMVSETASSQGIKLTYAVVPDKSTIYAPYLVQSPFNKNHDIWSALDKAGVDSIDLHRNFKNEAATVRDFYFPNDTHLSVAGFISMGRQVSLHLDMTGRHPRKTATSAAPETQ